MFLSCLFSLSLPLSLKAVKKMSLGMDKKMCGLSHVCPLLHAPASFLPLCLLGVVVGDVCFAEHHPEQGLCLRAGLNGEQVLACAGLGMSAELRE